MNLHIFSDEELDKLISIVDSKNTELHININRTSDCSTAKELFKEQTTVLVIYEKLLIFKEDAQCRSERK